MPLNLAPDFFVWFSYSIMDILKNQITHLKNGNFLPVPSAFSYKDPTENSFWSLFRKMLKLSLVLNGVVVFNPATCSPTIV